MGCSPSFFKTLPSSVSKHVKQDTFAQSISSEAEDQDIAAEEASSEEEDQSSEDEESSLDSLWDTEFIGKISDEPANDGCLWMWIIWYMVGGTPSEITRYPSFADMWKCIMRHPTDWLAPFEFPCRMESAAASRPARPAHEWASKVLRDGVDGKDDAEAEEPDSAQTKFLAQKWLRREMHRDMKEHRKWEQELNRDDGAEAEEPSPASSDKEPSSSDEEVGGHRSEIQIGSDGEDKEISEEDEENTWEFAAMVDCLPEEDPWAGFVTPPTRVSSNYLQETVPKTRRCRAESPEDASDKSSWED